MEKIKLSITFDVRPDQEERVSSAVKQFLIDSFKVNRMSIAVYRKEVKVKNHG